MTIYLYNIKSNTLVLLRQVWRKFAQLFSRRRIFILKCEKFTDKNNFYNFTVGTAPIPFLVKQQKNNTGPNRHNHCNSFLRRRWNGAVLCTRQQSRVPVSEQIWHDEDPSLLNGHKRRVWSNLHRQWLCLSIRKRFLQNQ